MPRNLAKRFWEIKREEGLGSAFQSAANFSFRRICRVFPYSVQCSLYARVYSHDVENFDYAPNPYTPINIDPHKVKKFTGREWPPWRNKSEDLGSVRDGDWDITTPPIASGYENPDAYELFRADTFDESVFFQSFKERFMNSVEWENTELVSRCLELAERDIPSWKGFTSKKKIINHCSNVDDLFEEIQRNGFKSQMDLGNIQRPTDVTKEVCVDIGRNGEILFVNGRHRMAISKLLNIEIPVCVLVRHRKWMDRRTSPKDHGVDLSHPDGIDL